MNTSTCPSLPTRQLSKIKVRVSCNPSRLGKRADSQMPLQWSRDTMQYNAFPLFRRDTLGSGSQSLFDTSSGQLTLIIEASIA
jgi:hypothetical protein